METKTKDNVKQVTLLGLTSFLNDVSSEIILPILPFFLTSLGASPLLIGIVGGLRESLSSTLKIFCGYLSDRIGKRKPFIYLGYFISSLFKLLLGISSSGIFAVMFASLERIGKGIRDAPRDALIGQLMPKETGKGFGIQRALDTAGAFVGVIISIVLLYYLGVSFSLMMVFAGVIGFVSLVPVFFVNEPNFSKLEHGILFSFKNLPRKVKIFMIVGAFFALANFSYMFFLMKVQLDTGELIYPLLLYLLYNFFYAISAYPIGTIADIVGKKKMLTLGYLVFACILFLMAGTTDILLFSLLFVLYGICIGLVETLHKAYVYDISPQEMKGVSVGMFQTFIGLTALMSSTIAGGLWELSPTYTFIFGGLFALLAVLLFQFIRNE